MKYTEDPYIQCPFYHKEAYNTIVCEGLYDKCYNRISFLSGMGSFKHRYCHSNYKECRLYRSLMEKYPD